MTRVVRESSALEVEVKPLIDAANTEGWRHVLNILYLNGSVLEALEETGIVSVVSCYGDSEEVEDSLELIAARAKTNLAPLIKQFSKHFLTRILVALKQTQVKPEAPEEQQITTIMMTVMSTISQLEKSWKELFGAFVSGAFTISDLIAVGAFKGLTDMRDAQLSAGMYEEDYEDMIEGLRKLGIIEPRLQISLCSECTNYEFTISSSPSLKEICPRCGSDWVTQTLYMFKGTWNKIKSENSDLPLFVSSYLKLQISPMPFADIEIYPKAVLVTTDEESKKDRDEVEIDVYIPQFDLGIECKIYENPKAPMTRFRVDGITGGLLPQMKKYSEAGIKKILVITNLPEASAEKVERNLTEVMKREEIKPIDLKIIPRDVDILIETLDKVANKINREIQAKFEGTVQINSEKPSLEGE